MAPGTPREYTQPSVQEIPGGSVNDKITKFYKSDDSFSANLVPAPQGKSDTDFITGLLSTADKYNETPVGYKYFPSGGDNGNCLSLESFLLMQNGVSPAVTAKALDHPGLDVGADKVITPKVKEPPKKREEGTK